MARRPTLLALIALAALAALAATPPASAAKLRPCGRREKLRAKVGKHVLRYRALSERGRPGPAKKFRFKVVRKR